MDARSGSFLNSIYILAIIAGAACSVVNAGEEPTPANSSSSTTTSSSSSSGTGGGGGEGGCGDGDIQDPEECDDSGESATCDDDCTAVECLDGNANAAAGEECDDGDESATCDADCTNRVCGDGTTNPTAGEECDDNNVTSNDGCSSECVAEGKCSAPAPLDLVDDGNGGLEADMNWATSGEGLVGPADCDGQSDIGQGPDRVFELTLNAASTVNITLTGSGWDPVLRLMEAACSPATEVPEGGSEDGCSDVGDVGAIEHLDYTALAAGTYFILVDGATPTDSGSFQLHVGIQ